MINRFERLKSDEVISPSVGGLKLPHTFKVKELIEVVKSNFGGASIKLFENGGLELEVLRLDAKGWRKGKLRSSLEFCPDEPAVEETQASNEPEIAQPESPLDDIRRMMNENS